MSLARLKTLYCIAVMAAGIILAARAGFIGWLAAILILSCALPAWRMVVSAVRSNTITAFEYRAHLRARLKEPHATLPQASDHLDNPPEALKEPRSTHQA